MPVGLRAAQLPLPWQQGKPILGEAGLQEAELLHAGEILSARPAAGAEATSTGSHEAQASLPEEPVAGTSCDADSLGTAAPAEPPAERKEVAVDPEFKIWFLQLAPLRAQRYG